MNYPHKTLKHKQPTQNPRDLQRHRVSVLLIDHLASAAASPRVSKPLKWHIRIRMGRIPMGGLMNHRDYPHGMVGHDPT